MSGDDTGYRYGLAVSLFDYFRIDHPWRHKSPAELTIADIVREVEVSNNRMARMTVMVKNLTAMTGFDRGRKNSASAPSRVREGISNPRKAKEWLRDEANRLARDPTTEQITLVKLDSLLCSLGRIQSVYADVGDDALLSDVVIATQAIRHIAEKSVSVVLGKVKMELSTFLSSIPKDLDRFDWTPNSEPPPIIPGTQNLLSSPRFLVKFRKQAQVVTDRLKRLQAPDVTALLDVRSLLGHHPAIGTSPVVVKALEAMRPTATAAKQTIAHLAHTFFRARLGTVTRRLASSPVKFTAFGTQQSVVHGWAVKHSALLERVFSLQDNKSIPLPITLPSLKESEGGEKLVIANKEEFDKLKNMFWTALDEVRALKTKMPTEWPITIPNLMTDDEVGEHTELLVEHAGFSSIMAAYADYFVVLKSLASMWAQAADSMVFLADVYTIVENDGSNQVVPGRASVAVPMTRSQNRLSIAPSSNRLSLAPGQGHQIQQPQIDESIVNQIDEAKAKLPDLPPITMETCFTNDELLPFLRKYLAMEMYQENFDLIRMVNSFQMQGGPPDLAQKIWDRFVRPEAQQQVNIGDATRNGIKKALEGHQIHPAMFNSAKNEALVLLSAPMSRFLQSQPYLDYLNDKLAQRKSGNWGTPAQGGQINRPSNPNAGGNAAVSRSSSKYIPPSEPAPKPQGPPMTTATPKVEPVRSPLPPSGTNRPRMGTRTGLSAETPLPTTYSPQKAQELTPVREAQLPPPPPPLTPAVNDLLQDLEALDLDPLADLGAQPPPPEWHEGTVAKELDFLDNLADDSLHELDSLVARSPVASGEPEPFDVENALETLSRMEESFGDFGSDW